MPKAIILGNGQIFIGLDHRAQVRDFYFPYVGLENHLGKGHIHRIGVWVDGHLSWFDNPAWEIDMDCGRETAASNIVAINREIGVSVFIADVVYNEKNIFIREITIRNLNSKTRTIKMFLGQQFELSESRRGNTAYYDPRCKAIIHYKGKRVFLINAAKSKKEIGFKNYSIGLFEIEGMEGTFKDAEDGELSNNPIEHGVVDSVIEISFEIAGTKESMFHYWVAVGQSIKEVHALNSYLLKKTPMHLMQTTRDFWHAWVNKYQFNFWGLDSSIIEVFKKSLFILRSHADNRGAIIASGDSDMLQHGRDTYSYMWPRDGAFVAMALDRVGDFTIGKRFFQFCNDVVSDEGYFMHKYRPDKSLGSSWHPWIRLGKAELPIQEDETSLVLIALWKHYELTKDLEFIEDLYNSLIKKSADFIANYTYKDTGLSYPSYDIWEEKYGISTFTCSAKYAALYAASKFADLLGKNDSAKHYSGTAEKVKEAMLEHLYNEKGKMFYKLINITKDNQFEYDPTVDMSSFYGIFKFNVLEVDDKRVQESLKTIQEKLVLNTDVKGVSRYENDMYYRVGANDPPNPWFVTTLWFAQYYVKIAKNEKDLAVVKDWLSWSVKHALKSGIMSEKLHPYTGDQLSVAPLAWSHAEFVTTVIDYLEKLEELGICKMCNPVK
ncbi:glycoside hydrolase family 15 protein [Patescibacteria group bacterium]|nr:glycoside hydrolase family 15 protein [Patescibacteria group bacterium]